MDRACRTLLWLYGLYLLLPIYWLITVALQSSADVVGEFQVVPTRITFANFAEILNSAVWRDAFANSISYVLLNSAISLAVAVPAAYVFSRYRFLGDRQLFFWLLTNRMAPPAVFLLPFFQLYSAVGLFDTPFAVALAHCLFTVPLAVWILEGFFSAVPREIDEIAKLDGFSFIKFFSRIFIPINKGAIGVTFFFCFMFSWVELLLARTLSGSEAKPVVVVMTRTVSASGLDWGVLAAAGVLTVVPGILVVWFVRKHLVKGFALGRV